MLLPDRGRANAPTPPVADVCETVLMRERRSGLVSELPHSLPDNRGLGSDLIQNALSSLQNKLITGDSDTDLLRAMVG
jgi:hypothetical protein